MMMNNTPSYFSFSDYLQFTKELVAQGKTSGNKQTPALATFTALNLKRMERVYKTFVLTQELETIANSTVGSQVWYVIAETWCGDCAQNIPAVARITESYAGLVEVRIILRDENPDWMEKYTTNGSKSIPKVIAFDSFGRELFTWGPRPSQGQKIVMDWKANAMEKSWDDMEKELHLWYAKDRSESIQNEFILILKSK